MKSIFGSKTLAGLGLLMGLWVTNSAHALQCKVNTCTAPNGHQYCCRQDDDIVPTGAAFAIASMAGNVPAILNCVLRNNGQSVQIVLADNAGAKVVLSEQTLSGSFGLNDEPVGTRLSGYKSLEVDASYALPDYSKPHTVKASLVLSPPNFDQGFGWISIKGLIATIDLAESGADCTSK